MNVRRVLRLNLPAILLLLSACSSQPYTVTFNDNVLYSPNEALRNKIVADPSLQGCINEAVARMEEPDPLQLTTLACPDAGIQSLEGLNVLVKLQQLELSNNRIDNLSPLQPLRDLRMLGLRNNRIRNIGTLTALPALRFVALEGNDQILCRQLDELGTKLGSSLNRPASCVR